jgi:hypothetical protein
MNNIQKPNLISWSNGVSTCQIDVTQREEGILAITEWEFLGEDKTGNMNGL